MDNYENEKSAEPKDKLLEDLKLQILAQNPTITGFQLVATVEEPKPMKIERYDPPAEFERKGFTKGKEYRIFRECYYKYHKPGIDFWYLVENDDKEKVWAPAACFYQVAVLSHEDEEDYLAKFKGETAEKFRFWATCNVREAYKQLAHPTPFERIIVQDLPVWRKLAGVPDKSTIAAEIVSLNKQLKSVMSAAQALQFKIEEMFGKRLK